MPLDYEKLLEEAETQYHKLALGRAAVEFRDQNGELVRYTPANMTALAKYIENLKRQLGLIDCGPLRVTF